MPTPTPSERIKPPRRKAEEHHAAKAAAGANKGVRSYARQLLEARRLRWALVQLLGGKCMEPGCDAPEELLEFDHLEPRDWEPREHNQVTRLRKYWVDWEHGRLCLRCKYHNGLKGFPAGQLELLEARAAVKAQGGEQPF